MRKPIQGLLSTCVIFCASLQSHCAFAQAPTSSGEEARKKPNFVFSENLYKQALSNQGGAERAALFLGECHGFLSELYNHNTRKALVSLRDIVMNEAIARDSQRAGYAAIFVMFNHTSQPDIYVDRISKDARKIWRPRVQKMENELREEIVDKLLECKQAGLMFDHIFEEALRNADLP